MGGGVVNVNSQHSDNTTIRRLVLKIVWNQLFSNIAIVKFTHSREEESRY